jgi:hypothetical protein
MVEHMPKPVSRDDLLASPLFFRFMTRRLSPGTRVAASDLYRAWCDWSAFMNSPLCTVSPAAFGRAMSETEIPRARFGSGQCYIGLTLIDGDM